MIQKLIQYLKGVQSEMAKVSWPSKDEITDATTLVVIVSLVFAVVVWVFDLLLNKMMGFLLNL